MNGNIQTTPIYNASGDIVAYQRHCRARGGGGRKCLLDAIFRTLGDPPAGMVRSYWDVDSESDILDDVTTLEVEVLDRVVIRPVDAG